MFDEKLGIEVRRRGLFLLKVMPGSRTQVVLQSDAVEVVQTHWFDKQYLCPGWDCPACGTYGGRVGVFFVGLVRQGPEWAPCLVELTAGAWSRAGMLIQMESMEIGPGLCLELSRHSARKGVRAEPVEWTENINPLLATRERLVDALGVLFRLPARGLEETAAVWVERVRSAVAKQIEDAVRKVG